MRFVGWRPFILACIIAAGVLAFPFFRTRWVIDESKREMRELVTCEILRFLLARETSFLTKDQNANGIDDYWTGDVAGLYDYEGGIAEADASPLQEVSNGSRPYDLYFFIAMDADGSENPPIPYRQIKDKDGRKVFNRERFGFCAYPSEYGKKARKTFIVNEKRKVFKIDNGGKPVLRWPTDEELKKDWEAFYIR